MKESIDIPAQYQNYQPAPNEQGYVHVLVRESWGEKFEKPVLQKYYPQQWFSDIRHQPQFMYTVIWDPTRKKASMSGEALPLPKAGCKDC